MAAMVLCFEIWKLEKMTASHSLHAVSHVDTKDSEIRIIRSIMHSEDIEEGHVDIYWKYTNYIMAIYS